VDELKDIALAVVLITLMIGIGTAMFFVISFIVPMSVVGILVYGVYIIIQESKKGD